MNVLSRSNYSSVPAGPLSFVMSITPFDENGEIDAVALAAHLDRMAEAGLGVYLGSPGSGEGHAMSDDELRRIYRIGVDRLKGRVPIFANAPEARTVDELVRKAHLALDSGVDVVQLYTVDGGHGFRPTEAEQELFFRCALDRIDGPVGLAMNLLAGGYRNSVEMFARIVADYPRVVSINILQPPSDYIAHLMEACGRGVEYFAGLSMVADAMLLGAAGCISSEANIVPHMVAALPRLIASGACDTAGKYLRRLWTLKRTNAAFVAATPDGAYTPRWTKAVMAALDLPGGNNAHLRSRYISPSPAELGALGARLSDLDLRSWEDEAAKHLRSMNGSEP